jgi:hypothetical protein
VSVTKSDLDIAKDDGKRQASKSSRSADCNTNNGDLEDIANRADNVLRQLEPNRKQTIAPDKHLEYLKSDEEYRNSFIEYYRRGSSYNAAGLVQNLQRIREAVQPYLELLDYLETETLKDQMRQRENE